MKNFTAFSLWNCSGRAHLSLSTFPEAGVKASTYHYKKASLAAVQEDIHAPNNRQYSAPEINVHDCTGWIMTKPTKFQVPLNAASSSKEIEKQQ